MKKKKSYNINKEMLTKNTPVWGDDPINNSYIVMQ